MPKNYEKMDIGELEKKLRRVILKSAKKNIGKKKISQQNKPSMTQEITNPIKRKNKLRKTVAQNREEWIETSAIIKKQKKEQAEPTLTALPSRLSPDRF